uniref:Aminotransferase-like plant mobile domain-containing protein n=1 Tax=Chenopodium quinoa TaxID=63459 RepID=A0A803MX79_CHEQI
MKQVIVGLPEAHKQAVRDVGFGSFLLLDLDSNKNSFCHELVASFNPDRDSIQLPNREEIEVLPEDVHAVFGLPIGGREIKDNKWIEEDEESQVFLQKWRDQFDDGSPTNTSLIQLIETQKDEDATNEFIWNFIVAAINCCVRSTSRSTLNFKFLYCCENVSQIKTYDWCTYTFENLINSVAEWKEGAAYFTGPLPFLMVMYFDSLKRGTAQPRRTIPLISVWNKQMIQERMKVEMKRGFGQGKVLDRLTAINKNSGEENQGPSSSSAPEDVKSNYNLFVGSQALPPTPSAKGKSPEQEKSPTEQHLESLTEFIVHKITMEHCEEPVT